MEITQTQVVQKLRDLLSADTGDFADWCSTNLGQLPGVYVGIDVRDPPGEEQCPFVVVRPGVNREGEDQQEYDVAVSVDWGILSGDADVSGRVTEYAGLYTIDGFGRVIWECLTAGISEQVSLSRSEYELSPIEFFPMLLGGMDITITVPYLVGADQIEM